jgi:3'-phosphoadenosine 5'-phosphosulfate sulfotransferase (PAPS reductase)/FAD synthetase
MKVIFGNYGNETIALIQWAAEAGLDELTVVSIDTGWAAGEWPARVHQGEQLAKSLGFKVVRLKPKADFARQTKEHQGFPSPKFQWCSGFLKGLTLVDWLDSCDPGCEATVLLGRRRVMSRAQAKLPEFVSASEHYGERKVWHPLYDYSDAQCHGLVERAGMAVLTHRSLECDPCINNNFADFIRLGALEIERTRGLEQELQQPMFAPESYGDQHGIEQVVHWVKKQKKSVTLARHEALNGVGDMGCGSPFGCGL